MGAGGERGGEERGSVGRERQTVTRQSRRSAAARINFPWPPSNVVVVILMTSCLLSRAHAQYSVHRSDPFATLSATLRTRQQAACDGQELTLECPTGTKVI